MTEQPTTTPTTLQSRYEQSRAAWQRDVIGRALAERLEQGIAIAEQRKEKQDVP